MANKDSLDAFKENQEEVVRDVARIVEMKKGK